MKVNISKNENLVDSIKKALEKNDGYCPCAIQHTDDTKCMCKDFRTKVENGYMGPCNCGLYINEPNIVYLCGDLKFRKDFIYWNKIFSLMGMIVLMPGVFKYDDSFTEEEAKNLSDIAVQKTYIADMIFIIDKYGHIDDATRKEIELAKVLGKKIEYASEIEEPKICENE